MPKNHGRFRTSSIALGAPAGLATIATLLGCAGCPVRAPAPGAIGWVVGEQRSLDSLTAHGAALSVVSPADYRVALADDGTTRIEGWWPLPAVDQRRVRALARERGVPLVPLLSCFDGCAKALGPRLADGAFRRRHIARIVRLVQTEHLDGVFIDYEGLRCPAAAFSALVGELGQALHRKRSALGVAVPIDSAGKPDRAYDLRALAHQADYLALMAYDYRVDGSDAVAPRAWLVELLRMVRARLPRRWRSVYVGVPLYGRLSAGLAPRTDVLWRDLRRGTIDGQPVRVGRPRFDPAKLSRVATVRYGKDQRAGQVHFQDHTTVAARLRVISEAGFRRVAVWRLGGEDPELWAVLRRWLEARRGQ